MRRIEDIEQGKQQRFFALTIQEEGVGAWRHKPISPDNPQMAIKFKASLSVDSVYILSATEIRYPTIDIKEKIRQDLAYDIWSKLFAPFMEDIVSELTTKLRSTENREKAIAYKEAIEIVSDILGSHTVIVKE